MTSPFLRLEIPSAVDRVAGLCAAVRALVSTLGGGEADADAVELGLAEVLNNIIEHGYRGEPGHAIQVDVWVEGTVLWVQVSDAGRAMPEALLRDAAMPDFDPGDVGALPEGGFGLGLLVAIADDIRYHSEEGRNVLTFSRTLHSDPERS